ncbi:MAG: helix-turn-helix domain-containing protein [Alphaproteobacteria bacterium]
MNIHSNARTTPHSRALMIERFWAGQIQQSIADDLGVSRRTVCKWIRRGRDGGRWRPAQRKRQGMHGDCI